MKRSTVFWMIARIFIGGLFAYAGFAKLVEPAANFEAALLKYDILSPAWIPWLARLLPWMEWLLGSFLAVGYLPRLTSALTAGLGLSFLAALAGSGLLLKEGGSDCGCFGSTGLLKLSVRQIFVLDLVMVAGALRLVFLKAFPFSLDHFLSLPRRQARRSGQAGRR